MRLSQPVLMAEARTTGFNPEVLEKVAHLLNLLEAFRDHPFLGKRIVLKGGTALNLFVFDVPRLSADIDFNYVGAVELSQMKAERPDIERAIQAVCGREGLGARRTPSEHAGGKFRFRFDSALGGTGNLEVNVNFMLRIPLWPVLEMDSRRVGSYGASRIPVSDLHELAAGKLTALLSRRASRDLFDAHTLLAHGRLEQGRLRLAFVVYGAMQRKDWRTVLPGNVGLEAQELERRLLPVLRTGLDDYSTPGWAESMVGECRERLRVVLPFNEAEREFLDRLLDDGEIEPSLLTEDEELAGRIRNHPGLKWKALNVKKFRGIS